MADGSGGSRPGAWCSTRSPWLLRRLERRAFEEIYLAKDDGKGKPGVAASEFTVSDVPIHCVVRLVGPAQAKVRMNLVAADVAGVKPETQVVSSSYTTKADEDRVFFLGRPERLWTPGTYRADVYINDILVNKLEFEIRGPAAPVKSALGFQPKQPVKPRRAKRN